MDNDAEKCPDKPEKNNSFRMWAPKFMWASLCSAKQFEYSYKFGPEMWFEMERVSCKKKERKAYYINVIFT